MDVLLPVLSRWVHVGAAIVLIGGTVFLRYVLLPAEGQDTGGGDSGSGALGERLQPIWRRFVFIGILLLLVSGIYNYWLALAPHKGDGIYHMLMGIKIILAVALFFVASALAGRSAALARFRQNARLWLTVNVVLAAVIVGIAGYLKVAVKATQSPDSDAPRAAEVEPSAGDDVSLN